MNEDLNSASMLNLTDEDPSLALPILGKSGGGAGSAGKIEEADKEPPDLRTLYQDLRESFRVISFPDIAFPDIAFPGTPICRPSLDLVEARLKAAIAKGMTSKDSVLGKIQCGDVEEFIEDQETECHLPFTEFTEEGITIKFDDAHLPLSIDQIDLKLGDPIIISFEETDKVIKGWVTCAGMEIDLTEEESPEYYLDYNGYCPELPKDLDFHELTWLPFEYDSDRKPIKFPSKPKLKIGDLVNLNNKSLQGLYNASLFVVIEVGYKYAETIGNIACAEWDDLSFGWCYRLGWVDENYHYSEVLGLFSENEIEGIFLPIGDLRG